MCVAYTFEDGYLSQLQCRKVYPADVYGLSTTVPVEGREKLKEGGKVEAYAPIPKYRFASLPSHW